jgi:maltooligosyltrehalose trehalohydrolase
MTTHTSKGPALGRRRFSQGAELVEGGVNFRVWAPLHQKVAVVLGDAGADHSLRPEDDGFWSATVPGIGAGTRYRYCPPSRNWALPSSR